MKWVLWVIVLMAEPLLAGQWEYLKVLNSKEALSIDSLNSLGKQCWELVACPVDGSEVGRKIYLELEETAFIPYAHAMARYCIYKRPNPRQKDQTDSVCP